MRALRAALALGALGAASCAEPPDVVAYDVELAMISDCRQTGVNTQCTQADELDDTVRRGRWFVEERDTGEFVLTLEDGRTMTGLSLLNDGSNALVVPAADDPTAAVGCSGEGGICYFARDSRSSTDTSLNCPREDEHAVIFHVVEGAVRGQVVVAFQTSSDCSTPSAAVAIVDVKGAEVDEPSRAREVYE